MSTFYIISDIIFKISIVMFLYHQLKLNKYFLKVIKSSRGYLEDA